MAGLKHLSGRELNAVVLFSERARKLIGDNLVEVKVFGSKVRGESGPESDIDIVLIVKKRDLSTTEQISEITADINVAFDVVISPVIYSEHEYERNRYFDTLFIQNIEREGVAV
jgi:predicted nucleotidyltransferase